MQRFTLRSLFAGILIGIGSVLPGVSGGVMAVSFGLYQPMLHAILHFLRAPGKHLRFLGPLGMSIGAGMLLGAKALSAVMNGHEALMMFLFIGLIAGGIPDLLREAERREPFRPRWLLALLAGIALAAPLALIPPQTAQSTVLTPVQALLTGVLEGAGTVIPGVSTSFVLMHLGWYQAYLNVISGMVLENGLLIGLGFGLSALACIRAVQWLFERRCGYAYYAVLGFLAVSAALVFPGFESGWAALADAGMLAAGAAAARWMGKTQTKGVGTCLEKTAEMWRNDCSNETAS